MAALNTHSYDAKWKEELKNTNILDDQFFNGIANFPQNQDLINLSNIGPKIKRQAQNWRARIEKAGGGNNDAANGVDASDILHRVERAIHYRLHLTSRIEQCDVEEIDAICNLYKIPKSGDVLDFDDSDDSNDSNHSDDSNHPIALSHTDLEERLRESNTSLINAYVEQLAEVQNGSCAQGRTTRLFQIYTSFYE